MNSTTIKPTPTQMAAINSHGLTVLKSCPGSGKHL